MMVSEPVTQEDFHTMQYRVSSPCDSTQDPIDSYASDNSDCNYGNGINKKDQFFYVNPTTKIESQKQLQTSGRSSDDEGKQRTTFENWGIEENKNISKTSLNGETEFAEISGGEVWTPLQVLGNSHTDQPKDSIPEVFEMDKGDNSGDDFSAEGLIPPWRTCIVLCVSFTFIYSAFEAIQNLQVSCV
ncbi:hypothetical protein PoB_004261100 [Plakobranchus ocellatus]|uniref:Uncharacterized protein n=1 Tax=Plakobranchus ocellatus TaxID=259542 RepID=A0AAV4AYB9_9GAST|nr:hypothetical protein PoB_004261100 [Plakobranchus ocellatus]